jgi:predicted ester cyclase
MTNIFSGGIMKNTQGLILLTLLLCFIVGCGDQNAELISEEEAKAIIDQVMLFWNGGDPSIADELYLPGYIRHHPTPSDAASLDDLKDTVIANRTLFPDYRLAIDDRVIEGDRLIVFAAVTGTNTAPLGEQAATGKTIEMFGIYIFRIAEGKIAEEWTYFNLLSYYQQLGYSLLPPQ